MAGNQEKDETEEVGHSTHAEPGSLANMPITLKFFIQSLDIRQDNCRAIVRISAQPLTLRATPSQDCHVRSKGSGDRQIIQRLT